MNGAVYTGVVIVVFAIFHGSVLSFNSDGKSYRIFNESFPTFESSTRRKFIPASPAFDGNIGLEPGEPNNAICSHTKKEFEPWWYVDLMDMYVIDYVVLYNRKSNSKRLNGAQVRVGTNTEYLKTNQACSKPVSDDRINKHINITLQCDEGTIGNIVSVQLENRTDFLTLCEVIIYGESCGGEDVKDDNVYAFLDALSGRQNCPQKYTKKFIEENVINVTDALEKFTSNTTNLNETSVSSVADILQDVVDLEIADEKVCLAVSVIVNNIIESDILGADTDMREISSSIVTSLEKQLSTTTSAGINFTSVNPNVGAMTLSVNPEAVLSGFSYLVFSDTGSSDEKFQTEDVNIIFDKNFSVESVGAGIALPFEFISINQSSDDEVQMYFTVYKNSSLFISNKFANSTRAVGSQVISASIAAVKTNGSVQTVQLAFLPIFKTKNTECVFWDFSIDNGVGDWSNRGCTYKQTTNDRVVCTCDHLTNFAILVDYYDPKDLLKFQGMLTSITLIGCIVSIASLMLTVPTLLFCGRNKVPQKILVNLSISLLLLYLVFVIGIEQTDSSVCIFVAALIHYFALSSIFWMSIEAVSMYLLFVKVFYDNIRYFMLKVCAVGYGIPMIIVVVCMAVDVDHYVNKELYCFIPSGNVRNFGFILLVGVLLLFNGVIFILVIHTLICRRKPINQSKKSQIIKRLQNAVAVSVLLGLTWITGFFAIDVNSTFRYIFQLLFCVFNSFQGLFIFLLFCVLQEDIREGWKNCCRKSDSKTTDISKKKDHNTTNTSNTSKEDQSHTNPHRKKVLVIYK